MSLKAATDGSPRGTELLEELSTATGLPDELIGEELSRLISGAGKNTDEITLDDLRELLGAYLQDVLLQAKDAFEKDISAKKSTENLSVPQIHDSSTAES